MMMNDDEGWRRMIDFKVFWGFAFRRTDKRTDEQTFVIVESLSRLKRFALQLIKICIYEDFLRFTTNDNDSWFKTREIQHEDLKKQMETLQKDIISMKEQKMTLFVSTTAFRRNLLDLLGNADSPVSISLLTFE